MALREREREMAAETSVRLSWWRNCVLLAERSSTLLFSTCTCRRAWITKVENERRASPSASN